MIKKTHLRSLLVSLLTTALEAGLFALCTFLWMGLGALVAARWICGGIGAVCNFALNRVWAFKQNKARVRVQAVRYALAAGAAVSMATLVWYCLFKVTGWDPRLLQLLSMALVWLSFTFPLLRGWVFRSSPST